MLSIRINRNFPNISPIALRKAKTVYNFSLSECKIVYNFGLSECKRVKNNNSAVQYVECGRSQLGLLGSEFHIIHIPLMPACI